MAISAVVVLCYYMYRMLPRRINRLRPATTATGAALRGQGRVSGKLGSSLVFTRTRIGGTNKWGQRNSDLITL